MRGLNFTFVKVGFQKTLQDRISRVGEDMGVLFICPNTWVIKNQSATDQELPLIYP